MADSLWTLEFELGYLDQVRRVTREDVRKVAERYLAAGHFTTALLAPTDGSP